MAEQIEIVPSRENFLERFMNKFSDRIERCYEKEWNAYILLVRDVLDHKITEGLHLLLLDDIETIPSTVTKTFTRAQKKDYCEWMFSASVLYLNERGVKVGDRIKHDLPLSFRFKINEKRAANFTTDSGLPRHAIIKEYNSLVKVCLDKINKLVKDRDFEFRLTSTGVDTEYQSFVVNLVQFREFNKAEEILIRGSSIEALRRYNPNEFWLNKDKSSESVAGVVTATLGICLLAGIVVTLATKAYVKIKSINDIKRVTQYFTADELTMFEHFVEKLSKDIDKLEDLFVRSVSSSKKAHVYDISISDNFRVRATEINYGNMGQQIHAKQGKLDLILVFRSVLNPIYADSITAEYMEYHRDIVKDTYHFLEKTLPKYQFIRSRVKVVNTNEPVMPLDDHAGHIECTRKLTLELPKEIRKLVENISERLTNVPNLTEE